MDKVRFREVVEGWASLIQAKVTPLSEIRQSTELVERLIRLTLIADEASVGIGISWDSQTTQGPSPSKFLSIAERMLVTNELQSFCWEVPRDVLINPIPRMVDEGPGREGLNLLLLPWPTRVATEDFQEVATGAVRADGSEPVRMAVRAPIQENPLSLNVVSASSLPGVTIASKFNEFSYFHKVISRLGSAATALVSNI